MPTPKRRADVWSLLSRRMLSSAGARKNAAQGLRDVHRDQADRAAADDAVNQSNANRDERDRQRGDDQASQ